MRPQTSDPPPGRSPRGGTLQTIVPTGTARVRRPGQRCWISDLPPSDVVTVGHVPVTTPARTALDLARYSPGFVGLAALDAFAHQGTVERRDLVARCRALAGGRNIARARRLVELCEPATESAGESWLRLRIFEAGLPLPEPQISIRDRHGREVYPLDMGYRDQKVAIEYDGEAFHHSSAEQQRSDLHRRDDLERQFGWTVVGVHRGDVLGRRNDLERTVAELIAFDKPVLARQQW